MVPFTESTTLPLLFPKAMQCLKHRFYIAAFKFVCFGRFNVRQYRCYVGCYVICYTEVFYLFYIGVCMCYICFVGLHGLLYALYMFCYEFYHAFHLGLSKFVLLSLLSSNRCFIQVLVGFVSILIHFMQALYIHIYIERERCVIL